MKEWLESQNRIEKDLLQELGFQCRDILDLLLPQIRLAALENNNKTSATINLDFDFSSGVLIKGEGSVTFPAKKATIELAIEEDE
jgi:hypothetical protein